MATKAQIHKDFFAAVEQLREINEQKSRALAELSEIQNKVESLTQWREEQIELVKRELADLEKHQELFDASIDRTHLRLAISVEELNDRLIEKTQKLKEVVAQIDLALEKITSLDKETNRMIIVIKDLQVENDGVVELIRQSKVALEIEERKVKAAIQKRDIAIRDKEQALADTKELYKRETDVKINELRLRNYARKMGLNLF